MLKSTQTMLIKKGASNCHLPYLSLAIVFHAHHKLSIPPISQQTPLRRSEEGFEISRYNRLGLFAWEESGIL